MNNTKLKLTLACFLAATSGTKLFAQGTAFTYQGRLTSGTNVATGTYGMTFAVYGVATGGSPLAGVVTNAATSVNNGVFTVTLDFGNGVFTGAPRWLELAAQTNGTSGNYAILSPRQPITAVPYAMTAANLSGIVSDTQLSANVISGASTANAGTSANIPNTLVKRDAIGNFAVGTVSLSGVLNIGGNAINGQVGLAINGGGELHLQPDGRQGPVVIGGGFGASKLVVTEITANANASLNLQPDLRNSDVVIGGAFGGGKFRVHTDEIIEGNSSVCTLTIRGGCDVAEPFQMSTQDIPKGSVVIIDEENAGQLRLSDRAYDKRVAGIVSGANGIHPGLSISQEGVLEGGQNVALSGRVYALADASTAPIKPGDLLTTSSTPGHCMKVINATHAQGAIIGKAMSALKDGKGMVLVLVTLQ